jgi:hypothetical protein
MSADAQRPIPTKPNFVSIPAELKSMHNWVVWRYMPPKRLGGKWRKVPFQPNGNAASTVDRLTWYSFDGCCAVYTQGGFDGIGFVFDGEIGPDGYTYCGIDLDHCVENENIQSLAKSRIKLLNTYTEVSVSGTGIHCIVRAPPIDRIVKFDGVEVYTKSRYFTFTGHCFGTIRPAPAETRALIDEVRAKEAAAKQQQSKYSESRTAHNEPGGESGWFDRLAPEAKNQVIDYALQVIATRTKYLELEGNGGNNSVYYRLMLSCARSRAPDAEDLWVKWASQAHDADPEAELREEFHRCMDASPPTGVST